MASMMLTIVDQKERNNTDTKENSNIANKMANDDGLEQ